MGNVFAEITLKNGGDVMSVDRGLIADNEIRTITLNALVDTGAMTLVINEETRQKLGLSLRKTRSVTLAGGKKAICHVTEPVEIWWNDRNTIVNAWVLPGDGITLLGVIPLEDMDLIVDPSHNLLIGAHGDVVMGTLY
jgi:clan AA aspartic protease